MLHALTDVEQLTAVAGGDPLTRSALVFSEFEHGWSDGAATVWVGRRPTAPRVFAAGEPHAVAAILEKAAAELPARADFSVPAPVADAFAAYRDFTQRSDWELRWLTTPPPAHPGEARVQTVPADSAEIGDLIERAYPGSEARPGDPAIRSWAVIRNDTGRLQAAAADTSGLPTGRISGVMTAPQARGQGLGAAVTTALARRLLAEFGMTVLGLYLHNDAARRLYDRTGFHGTQVVASGSWG